MADAFDEERAVQTPSALLSWSHFIEIIRLKDPLQRQFYADMARVERAHAAPEGSRDALRAHRRLLEAGGAGQFDEPLAAAEASCQ